MGHKKVTIHGAHRILNPSVDGTDFTLEVDSNLLNSFTNQKAIDCTIQNVEFEYELKSASDEDPRIHTAVYLKSSSLQPNQQHHAPAKSSSIIQKGLRLPKMLTSGHHAVYGALLAKSMFTAHPLYDQTEAEAAISNYIRLKHAYLASQNSASIDLAHATAAAHLTLQHTGLTEIGVSPEGSYSGRVGINVKWHPHLGPPGTQTVTKGSANTITISGSQPAGTQDILLGSRLYLSGPFNPTTMQSDHICIGLVTDILDANDVGVMTASPKSAYDDFKAPTTSAKLVLDAGSQENMPTGGVDLYDYTYFFLIPELDAAHYEKAATTADDTSDAEYTAMMDHLDNIIKIPEISYVTDHADAIGVCNRKLGLTYGQASGSRTFKVSPPQHRLMHFSLEPMFRPSAIWRYNLHTPINVTFDVILEEC